MYSGHGGPLCVCLSLAAFPHYCTHPDVTWRMVGGAFPLVVHYWANFQSVHGFRCYNNVAPNAKCHRVLVLALSLALSFFHPLLFRRSCAAVCFGIDCVLWDVHMDPLKFEGRKPQIFANLRTQMRHSELHHSIM